MLACASSTTTSAARSISCSASFRSTSGTEATVPARTARRAPHPTDYRVDVAGRPPPRIRAGRFAGLGSDPLYRIDPTPMMRAKMSKLAAAAEARADLPEPEAPARPLTRFHERLLVEELSIRSGDGTSRLASALSEARVDLNPHQVEAAAFALESLSRGGCMLADEVGLGKTIEAGIVLAQLLAEGKGRLLVLAPATLRAQWQQGLRDKFDLDAVVVDGRTVRATGNPFDQNAVVIC